MRAIGAKLNDHLVIALARQLVLGGARDRICEPDLDVPGDLAFATKPQRTLGDDVVRNPQGFRAVEVGVDRRRATAGTATIAAVLGAWLVLSGLLARAGVYRQDPGEAVPWFPVVVAGTLIVLLLGLVEATPSTEPLLLLPLALMPTVPVPLALALHIVSLRRLRTAPGSRRRRSGRRVGPRYSPKASRSIEAE